MRLFLQAVDHPEIEFEVVSFDKEAQQIVLRGRYDEYHLAFPTTGKVAQKRKMNWTLQRREDA